MISVMPEGIEFTGRDLRFHRWSKRGRWQKLLAELVDAGAAPDLAMIEQLRRQGSSP